LYCNDNGRPNFPVNILLSLEIIKHLFDYADKEILEQFYFNFQVLYALGIRNIFLTTSKNTPNKKIYSLSNLKP